MNLTRDEILLAILHAADRPLLLGEILRAPRAVAEKLTKEDAVNGLRSLIEACQVRQFSPFQSYNGAGDSRPFYAYRLWKLAKLDAADGQYEMTVLQEGVPA